MNMGIEEAYAFIANHIWVVNYLYDTVKMN